MTEGSVTRDLEDGVAPPASTPAARRVGVGVSFWWLGLAVILLAAALLRLPALDRIPPGFQFDEAYNAIDAWRVEQGARDLFFPANGGREPLLSYWQALFLGLFGPSLGVLRLASAVIGLLTLVVVALALPRLLSQRPEARWLGLLAAGVLTVTYWHVHFSRYSIRAILVPLGMTLVFWAYDAGTRPRPLRPVPLFLAGVALAGSVYAHPTGRLIPFALALYTLWLAWADRRQALRYLASLGLVGAVSLVLFLPLGLYFLNHPWLFWGHPSDVFAIDTAGGLASAARSLLNQAGAVLGMVFVAGDRSNFHNLPYRPAFDPLLAVCFGVGLVLLARDGWRERGLNRAPYVLLLLWTGIGVAPTLLSDAAPNFSRAIGLLPVLALVAAVGLEGIGSIGRGIREDGRRRTDDEGRRTEDGGRNTKYEIRNTHHALRTTHYVLPILVLTLSGLWTAYDYFGVWANAPGLYYSYDADKEDAVRAVQGWQASGPVYLAPVWATHATVTFLTRDNPPVALDMERGLVLPPDNGQVAHYVFPGDQDRRARQLGGWLDEAATRTVVNDRQGKPLLIQYELPSTARPQVDGETVRWTAVRPDETRLDRFDAAPVLVGVSGDTQLSPGDRAQFLLYWRTAQPLSRDLTLFAHLVDAAGQTVLQDDHQPLATWYPTSRWATDEVVLDLIQFRLPDNLALGTYRVRVGWYDLATGERRPLVQGGTELLVRDLVVAVERK
ncbi:MAG: glycosyltransferase family 39 protein [Anaerolineae bacterium]|nr:glycosyltransferase family 39 protein [Anaerolineae bacterium]